MAGLNLTNEETLVIQGLETDLETAFDGGANDNTLTPIVDPLVNYDKEATLRPGVKGKIKAPFKLLIAAVLKNLANWVEGWHEVGTAGEPAFQNGWHNNTGGFQTAAYFKEPWNMVHLKGVVTGGSPASSVVFTLPIGYRPAATAVFTVGAEGAGGFKATATVSSNGNVAIQTTSSTNVSLDEIIFRAV